MLTFFSATIAVTYPEGSTCTCSDGSTTLTAPDTSGSYTFQVPNVGTWTVVCTDGEDTDSTTLTITTDGQSESVELSYWDGELYDSGNEYTKVTGGWQARALTAYNTAEAPDVTKNDTSVKLSQGTFNTSGVYEIINDVDVTDYRTLTLTVSDYSTGHSSNRAGLCIYDRDISKLGENWNYWCKYATAYTRIDATGEITLDVTEITGSVCIGILLLNVYTGSTITVTMTKATLTG